MSDLISRRAAIDRIVWWFGILKQNPDILIDSIKTLPSAHSEIEKRKEESAQNVPKEDLISRKAAIDAVENIDCSDGVGISALKCEAVGDVVTAIKALPPAQPERQWIPCSERLPEVGHSVLLSRRSMDTREGCLQADGKWWQYRWNEILNANQVNAWIPLPEPYRAERRTDE